MLWRPSELVPAILLSVLSLLKREGKMAKESREGASKRIGRSNRHIKKIDQNMALRWKVSPTLCSRL
jgi:hypothetical protein